MKETKSKIAKLKEELAKESKVFFETSMLNLLKKYPEVKFVSWHGYTPSFNDGDACYFSSYHMEPQIVLSKEDDEDEVDEVEAYSHKEFYKDYEEFMKEFDDDDMERMFGDGVEVTISLENDKLKISKSDYYE